MNTHTCPGCEAEFLPTLEKPATPLKVWRKQGRHVSMGTEPVCPDCVARLRSSGTWPLASGGEIMSWPSCNAKTHTSSCEGCGTIVALPEDKRRKIFYCSEKCRQVIYRKRNAKTHTSSCEGCGTEFTARRGAKYCSPKCRQAAYRARAAGTAKRQLSL